MADLRPFVPYEIALGDGEFARLVLPRDMTQAEADRLCGVIQSLAFDTASSTKRQEET